MTHDDPSFAQVVPRCRGGRTLRAPSETDSPTSVVGGHRKAKSEGLMGLKDRGCWRHQVATLYRLVPSFSRSDEIKMLAISVTGSTMISSMIRIAVNISSVNLNRQLINFIGSVPDTCGPLSSLHCKVAQCGESAFAVMA